MAEEQKKEDLRQMGVTLQYLKDFSVENPNAPMIFTPAPTPPDLNMGVNIQTRPVGEAAHEVLLMLKLEIKLQDKVALIVELSYGGVFTLPELPEDQIKYVLMAEAPKYLFPFARAIIANAVRDAGFPQVLINPIDFTALYVAHQNNAQDTVPAVTDTVN